MLDLEAIWTSLENKVYDKESTGILQIRLLPDSKYNIFLGYEKPNNKRILLLKVSSNKIPLNIELPKSKGFEVRYSIITGK